MKRLLLHTASSLSAAVLLTCVGFPASGWAESPDSQPVEGILVLRNGNLLRGKIQQQDDAYLLHLPNGSLQVRAKQVEMVCQNVEEAYQRRRQERGSTSMDSHLELAAWCLRHDLLGNAEQEIQFARAADPDHPRLGRLQRQLELSLRLAARIQEQAVEPGEEISPLPLDPAALEKAPPWARALFARQIQPLVVHSCATSGCHQSDSPGSFQLDRLAVVGAGHPEATLRNLAATLEQIDWENANKSDLLARAKKAHGSAEASSPLPSHKLKVLQGWVEQLAEAHRKDTELRTVPQLAEVTAPLELIPPQQTIASLDNEIRAVSYEPADPFDPAAFNRSPQPPDESASAPTEELAVPHILAPTHPVPIPLPPTE